MKLTKYLPLAAIIAIGMTACQKDMETFDNRVYEPNSTKLQSVLIDGMASSGVAIVKASIAKPLHRDMEVTFGSDFTKLGAYTEIYGEECVALPTANFTIDNPTVTILAGAVTSPEVKVNINLDGLDRNLVYVLPVSIVNAPIDVIESHRTSFIVVRGAALINVVCNINENFASLVAPGNASKLSGITQLTAEALFKVDEFGKLISTVMGIEGNFLLRIGDAGVPDNQLQLATSSGNVTDAQWQFKTNEWIALAVTFDSATGQTNVYINGVKKGSTQTSNYRQPVNWNSNNFYVGKSYDNNRYLDGCISEVRVWNRILSEEELMGETHRYVVPVQSEGLVAYWKFNDGSGLLVKDYANGYDLICNAAPTWVPVELPQ